MPATPEEHRESVATMDEKHQEKPRDLEADEPFQDVTWSFTRVVAVAALCIVYVGSQMLLYFVSPALDYLSADLHTLIPNWLLTANTLAVAAVCPFVGYLTDLLGRRWMAVFGTVCLLLSSILMGVAKSLGVGILAMAIGGVGAGICELTALAGVAELSPQRWRGVTLAVVTFSILPFMPAVLYVVLCQQAGTWRYTFAICGAWNFIGLIGIVFCYRPPPRDATKGLTAGQILKRIDYVGAFLSIGGVTLFLVGLQAGGYQYKWTDGRVLGPLISGIFLLLAFPAWEIWGPHEYPMVPAVIFRGQRIVALAFVIVFIAGMDFYSILGFFPIALQNVYHTSAIELGVRAISYPCAILGGACIVSSAMSYTNGHVRVLFLVIAAIMTAFTGALAASNPSNPGYTIAMATIAAFGNGGLVVPALTLALYACPDEYIGTTTALSLSARFVGGSIGTSVYFNVFNVKIKKLFPLMVGGAAVQAGLPQESIVPFVTAMNSPAFDMLAPQVPGANAAIIAAATMGRQLAFAESLKYVWYTTIPFGIISFLACFFLPNIKKYMTDRVAVNLH